METILNEEQIRAVTASEDACLVKACVGSGKTTVLIHRLLYLHKEKGIPFSRMAVITFTNKAADEIRHRIRKELPDLTPEDLKYFGTFHGLALTLLRELPGLDQLGYQDNFEIMTPEEEVDLALETAEYEKLKLLYKNRLKKRLEQYYTSPQKEKEKAAKDDFLLLTRKLEAKKIALNKMTFHDLIMNFIRLEAMNRSAPQTLSERDRGSEKTSKKLMSFLQVLVDEVQDCDPAQLLFLESLLRLGYGQTDSHSSQRKRAGLFAVGDPNQVIYSFRGSCLNIFNSLQRSYQASVYPLLKNYRSSASILAAARKFQESGEKLSGISEEDTLLRIHESYDPFADANYLAERIRELHDQGLPYSEIAVFYRMQSQAEVYKKVFEKENIPCLVRKRTGITDVPVLNWLIRYLKFLLTPEDLSCGVYAFSHKEYGPGLTAGKARKLLQKDLTSYLLDFDLLFQDCDSTKLYQQLELDKHLSPTRSTYPLEKAYVMGFLTDILSHCHSADELKDYLGQIALHGQDASFYLDGSASKLIDAVDMNPQSEDNRKNDDYLNLMTLHASKGLEFDHCFIVGVNNGLLPIKSSKESELEEERRLFYVGITRARKNLEFTCYTEPGMHGVLPGPGVFLKRIPSDLTDSNVKAGPAADFKTLRHLVEEEIRKKKFQEDLADEIPPKKDINDQPLAMDSVSDETSKKEEFSPEKLEERLFTHPRYGEGRILAEDDLMITVEFDGIGVKEFLKDFL